MRVEITMINGKDAGFNLVAEDEGDKILLQRVRNLHFLADKKAKKIEYDGVTLDKNTNISRVIFLQRRFASLPDHDRAKREIYKAIMRKGVPA
ncbi:hypothetical protein IR083_07660 [Dysgonomonas sp. GY75]|uniref:hypothetical protein n=1 Tax=Dysgonomonas sp. GY75 TaxID=2780419 RepID=UPI001883C624|nr:hypothetical protein [Dysgonomonas sp. GY75]MBF0648693.1 hypothetical protein [Dysgonomonas sp. GY75]